jgi:hypothetical protein
VAVVVLEEDNNPLFFNYYLFHISTISLRAFPNLFLFLYVIFSINPSTKNFNRAVLIQQDEDDDGNGDSEKQ